MTPVYVPHNALNLDIWDVPRDVAAHILHLIEADRAAGNWPSTPEAEDFYHRYADAIQLNLFRP